MLTPAPHIRWARCAPDAVAVLDLRNGTWRMFEGTGARIWAAIVARGCTDGLADEIAVPAGADPGATHTALDSYVHELRSTGLLTDAGTHLRTAGRARWWRRRR
ncbi:hypothetical protein [Streptomyces sp. NPDC051662]|uniref:hypothetical protein n=1 Tax=Streptomyces sp. NPDC051662 TaxID=3154750 RepID=UPI0034496EB8